MSSSFGGFSGGSTNVFGGNNNASSFGGSGGGNLFGSSSNTTSMFGGPSTTNNPSTSLFGSTPNTGGSQFGVNNNQGGGSLFGGGGGSGGSIFGGGGNPSGGNTGGGSLFGGNTTGGGSLFGGGGGNTSLFGGSNNTGGNTSSLFGGNTNTTSLFGGNNAPSTSLFGGNTGGGSNLFGNPTTTSSSIFGGNAGTGGSIFGGNPSGGSIFGGNTNTFGGLQPGQQQQRVDLQSIEVMKADAAGTWWYRDLIRLQAAYRVCQYSKFHTFMYEVVTASPDLRLARPQQITSWNIQQWKSERKQNILNQIPWVDLLAWQRFEDKNPDTLNWSAYPLIGIEALRDRVQLQVKNANEQLNMIDRTKNHDWIANAAADVHQIDEVIESCQRRYSELSHRLIGVLGRLEKLETRAIVRGPRSSAEIKFHERLEGIRKTLDHPSGTKSKLLEIQARLSQISSREKLEIDEPKAPLSQSSSTSIVLKQNENPNDEEAEEKKKHQKVIAFLEEQTQALSTIVEVLRRDSRDVRIIREKLMN